MPHQTEFVRVLEGCRLNLPVGENSVDSFAFQLKISHSAYRGWLKGDHVPSDSMARTIYARAAELDSGGLGVTLEEFLTMREDAAARGARRRRRNGRKS